jgi:hypothetical protein
LEEIMQEYLANTQASKLLAELTIAEKVGPFSLDKGIIQ